MRIPERLTPVTDPVRRHPRVALAATAVAVVAVAAAALTAAPSAPAAAAPAGPAFTYAGTWDLLELQRHIDAGEVVAVTVPDGQGDDAPGGTLAARTTSGQVIEVDLSVEASSAVRALADLGHDELLTTEAWRAATGAARSSGGPTDLVRTLPALILPIGLVVLLAFVLIRAFGRRGGRLGDADPTFTTIMPADTTGRAGKRRAGARRTGAGREGAEPASVRLVDVAGCEEVKLELVETIEFLRDPARFSRLGARIPHGILLYGPPGTGKTMLAKAVAAEAGVPFVHASGSEFVEKFVGVGARRIRDLFAHARKLGRAVVFLDEFDALGKARGGPNSHEEREQTLNQLLVELDGFKTTEDIVVIAATNRLDVLDPAVLRPGRFNRKIHVGLPDVRGRADILAVHARGKPLARDVDLAALARKTYGFSGAQLADLLNEAAILAARRGSEAIEPEDIHGGWLKSAVGTSRRRSMDERERSIIAAHEVGHAICGRVHGDRRKVEEISLFAHGEALGITVSSQEDNDLPSESDLRARLIALMGGRAAEELLFQEVTGGASNDFEKANQIATAMVTRYGMGRDPDGKDDGTSGRGSLSFLVARPNGSMPSEVQPAATRAIRAILDDAYEQASETLVEHMGTLRRIAAHLVEQERIDGETFEALFTAEAPDDDAAPEWRPVSARPREWGEIVPFRARRRRPRLVGEPVAAAPAAPVPVHPAPPVAAAAVATGQVERLVAPLERPVPPGELAPPPVEPDIAPGDAPSHVRVPTTAPRVPLHRRARHLAAGLLHAAESRVRPPEEARP